MRNILRRALPLLLSLLLIAGVYAGLHLALHTNPIGHSAYDSYTLQALSWREGRLSLGRDYPYLELAVYEGDWYVSFPPVPSVVQLPLTLIFGGNTPDGALVKLCVVGSFLLLYFYFRREKGLNPWPSALWGLFLVFATDMFSISLDGGVWYQAQALNFLFLTGAFVAMARKKPTLSCALFALAVGCRPYTVFFGLALLSMYLGRTRRLKPLLPGLLTGLAIAACYAAYNFARFGNPLEFGHNYLPEFTRVATGQFSLAYVWKNVQTFFFGLPFAVKDGALALKRFGFSMFLCNPILWMLGAWLAKDALRARLTVAKLAVPGLMLVHLFCLLMHKSFGGFQFGARYTLELIPYAFVYMHLSRRRDPRAWEISVFSAALLFNAVGAYLLNR
ncbi:MAG: hypothetical protein GX647_13645 [Clostridiales bacterium]|jgi:multisubunit Na+/H+ antiporter MnhB subunit|nr:hypothetical protein [Clostridiales bacterium]